MFVVPFLFFSSSSLLLTFPFSLFLFFSSSFSLSLTRAILLVLNMLHRLQGNGKLCVLCFKSLCLHCYLILLFFFLNRICKRIILICLSPFLRLAVCFPFFFLFNSFVLVGFSLHSLILLHVASPVVFLSSFLPCYARFLYQDFFFYSFL